MGSLTNVVVAGGDAAAAVARVEMLSPAGYAGLAVSSGLDVQGYVSDRQPDLVLLEDGFDDVDAFEVVRQLKRDPSSRHIPVIMLNAPRLPDKHREGLESGLDDMIDADTADDVIFARLRPFVRLSAMHAECIQRVATAKEFRIPVAMDGVHEADTANCRILFVGADSPAVSDAAEALGGTEFEIIRETGSLAALERLGEETFDAAIIAVERREDIENAYVLCSQIRNTMHLFNLPILIASGNGAELADATPYRHGASMALALADGAEYLATALQFLVRRQRIRWNLHGPLTATLQKNSSDALDGLYAEAFLRAHLSRSLDGGGMRRRNISLAVFALRNVPGVSEQFGRTSAARLMQQVADRISGMVRVQDIAARLNSIEICTLFPGAEERDATQACGRITGALQQAEFDIGNSKTMAVLTQSGIAAAVHGDTADSLIARARGNFI